MAKNLSKENFDQVIASSEAIVVDFWAPWCGPCKMQVGIIDEFLNEKPELSERLCKVNVDDEQDLAMRYGVMSIPTFIVFKNSQVVTQRTGVQNKAALQALLDL